MNNTIIDTKPINQSTNQLITYTLHLADNALIMGHRLSEWTGHGPVLDQDIAISNIALDYIGQARNFYQYAALQINECRRLGSGVALSPQGEGVGGEATARRHQQRVPVGLGLGDEIVAKRRVRPRLVVDNEALL